MGKKEEIDFTDCEKKLNDLENAIHDFPNALEVTIVKGLVEAIKNKYKNTSSKKYNSNLKTEEVNKITDNSKGTGCEPPTAEVTLVEYNSNLKMEEVNKIMDNSKESGCLEPPTADMTLLEDTATDATDIATKSGMEINKTFTTKNLKMTARSIFINSNLSWLRWAWSFW